MADKHLDLHPAAVLFVGLPAVEHRERVRLERKTRGLLPEPFSVRHGRVLFHLPRGEACLIRGNLSDGIADRCSPEIRGKLVIKPVEVRVFRVGVVCRLMDQSLHGVNSFLRERQSLKAVPVRQHHVPDIPAGRTVEPKRLCKHAALSIAHMIQFCLTDNTKLFHKYLL